MSERIAATVIAASILLLAAYFHRHEPPTRPTYTLVSAAVLIMTTRVISEIFWHYLLPLLGKEWH